MSHEHRCTCGAAWPITDADALRRQSGQPPTIPASSLTAAAAAQHSNLNVRFDLTSAAATNPMPTYRVTP